MRKWNRRLYGILILRVNVYSNDDEICLCQQQFTTHCSLTVLISTIMYRYTNTFITRIYFASHKQIPRISHYEQTCEHQFVYFAYWRISVECIVYRVDAWTNLSCMTEKDSEFELVQDYFLMVKIIHKYTALSNVASRQTDLPTELLIILFYNFISSLFSIIFNQ